MDCWWEWRFVRKLEHSTQNTNGKVFVFIEIQRALNLIIKYDEISEWYI
jgi:hypothetical protein